MLFRSTQLSIINYQLSINKGKWPESQSINTIDFNKIGYLGFDKFHQDIPLENQLLLSPRGDLNEAAKNLFAFMRLLDARGFDEIFTELLQEIGLGRAINDRIRRATSKKLI